MRVTGGLLFLLPVLALLAPQAQAQLTSSSPDDKAIPKPTPFKITPLSVPRPPVVVIPRFQTPIAAPPSPAFRAVTAPASNSKPGPPPPPPPAAKPPKPTLSAPEPSIKTVRKETL